MIFGNACCMSDLISTVGWCLIGGWIRGFTGELIEAWWVSVMDDFCGGWGLAVEPGEPRATGTWLEVACWGAASWSGAHRSAADLGWHGRVIGRGQRAGAPACVSV